MASSSVLPKFFNAWHKVVLLINGEWEQEFLCTNDFPSLMFLPVYMPDNSFITISLDIKEDFYSFRLRATLNIPGVDIAADGHLFLKEGSDLGWIHNHWSETGIHEVRFPSKLEREVMQHEHAFSGSFLIEPAFE